MKTLIVKRAKNLTGVASLAIVDEGGDQLSAFPAARWTKVHYTKDAVVVTVEDRVSNGVNVREFAYRGGTAFLVTDPRFDGMTIQLSAYPNSAYPNPDFGDGESDWAHLPPQEVRVRSLTEASAVFRSWRDANGLGGGNCGRDTGLVRCNGVPLARVSYNGRVWDVEQPAPGTPRARAGYAIPNEFHLRPLTLEETARFERDPSARQVAADQLLDRPATEIPATENTQWGFWGAGRQLGWTKRQLTKAWAEAIVALVEALRITPAAAREALDSRFGRHLVDQIAKPRLAGPTTRGCMDNAEWVSFLGTEGLGLKWNLPQRPAGANFATWASPVCQQATARRIA